MTIKRFEDLEIRLQARALCKKIRRTAEKTALGKDFSLKDQVFRSSGSVMDKIACPVK
jgi:four helix bundle protein